MTRLRGRAPKGERLVCHAPHGHWRTTTMIPSVRLDGTSACMAIEGATDTEVFQAHVREVLCPTLRPGDIVVMDNPGAHRPGRGRGPFPARPLPGLEPHRNDVEQGGTVPAGRPPRRLTPGCPRLVRRLWLQLYLKCSRETLI